MVRRLGDLLERLRSAASFDDLDRAVVALRDAYDVEHLVYHAVRGSDVQWGALTYPTAWVGDYIDNDLQTVDPVVQACLTRASPVDWKALDWSPRPVRELMAQAAAAGLGNQGCSLPIHGPGGRFAVFTVNDRASDTRWARFRAERLDEMILAAHYLNERALIIEGDLRVAPSPVLRLSPRESDALTLLATGASRAQAAERLAISEHTLRVYIESARAKLGAMNTTHAVAHALSHGLICL